MARMNAGLILAGQQPDFLRTIGTANALAAQQNEIQRQNEVNNFYRQNGAAVARGDQAALNSLAQFDPRASLDIQKQRLSMDATRQGMELQRQQAAIQAQKWAATQSAADVAAARDRTRRGLMAAGAAYQAGDERAFQRVLQEFGVEPFPMAQFPAQAAQYEGVLAGLNAAREFVEGPKPADEYGRYAREETKAGRKPLSRIEYSRAKQKTQQIEVGADGSVRLSEGFGGETQGKPPTERQSTLRLFGGLMDETMPAINAMEDLPDFDPASLQTAAAGGGAFFNYATTPEARKYEALKRQWAEGVLRIQTGAAATQPEIERVLGTYFPRPGDDDATIAQKREQRDAFARSLVPASGGTMQAPGGADTRGRIGAGRGQPEQNAEPDQGNAMERARTRIDEAEGKLSPEQRQEYDALDARGRIDFLRVKGLL